MRCWPRRFAIRNPSRNPSRSEKRDPRQSAIRERDPLQSAQLKAKAFVAIAPTQGSIDSRLIYD